jgi:hypothetical protein
MKKVGKTNEIWFISVNIHLKSLKIKIVSHMRSL